MFNEPLPEDVWMGVDFANIELKSSWVTIPCRDCGEFFTQGIHGTVDRECTRCRVIREYERCIALTAMKSSSD